MKSLAADGNGLMKLVSAVFARPERSAARAGDYFTPRLAQADRQLRLLATRLGAAHQRGAVDWSSFAGKEAMAATAGEQAEAVWGRGSLVTKALHGLHVEVTAIAQPLNTGERGPQAASRWLVLAPRVAVKAGARASQLRFDRFDAGWSADDEAVTGADRLRPGRAGQSGRAAALEAMPPAVSSARDRLIEKASLLGCGADHVFAIGRPLPRAAQDPREFGQASFEVASLLELIERARAFAHALATG